MFRERTLRRSTKCYMSDETEFIDGRIGGSARYGRRTALY
jgi:hypothetical protein